jgi:hypothetical protein
VWDGKDDEWMLDRAKACAVSMLTNVKIVDPQLDLHGGIASGSLLHLHLGDQKRESLWYIVTGDAVVRAVNLVEHAERGEILHEITPPTETADTETAEAGEDTFDDALANGAVRETLTIDTETTLPFRRYADFYAMKKQKSTTPSAAYAIRNAARGSNLGAERPSNLGANSGTSDLSMTAPTMRSPAMSAESLEPPAEEEIKVSPKVRPVSWGELICTYSDFFLVQVHCRTFVYFCVRELVCSVSLFACESDEIV